MKTPLSNYELKVSCRKLAFKRTTPRRIAPSVQFADDRRDSATCTASNSTTRTGHQNTVECGRLVQTGVQVSAAQLIWGELYSQIGWDQVLTTRCWSSNRIVKDLVLARLLKPQSKRRTVAEQPALAGPQLSLSRVYQTMDWLDASRIQKIQRGWQQRVRTLLNTEITAVFYDTTTLAFESAREDLVRRDCQNFRVCRGE